MRLAKYYLIVANGYIEDDEIKHLKIHFYVDNVFWGSIYKGWMRTLLFLYIHTMLGTGRYGKSMQTYSASDVLRIIYNDLPMKL